MADKHAHINDRNEIQIFVKDNIGMTSILNIKQDEEIYNVMKLIEMKTGIKSMSQRIIYEGKELVPLTNKSIKTKITDYNIKQESTLHLSLSLKGGFGDSPPCYTPACCYWPTSSCGICCCPCQLIGCFWNSTLAVCFGECCICKTADEVCEGCCDDCDD
eukprot:274107_1